jgi:DNA-binding CsgD family transcriptional regulator
METDPEIIDRVYEAAAVPELWPSVLTRLCATVNAWGAGLLAFDPAQHTRFTATPNYVEGFENFAAKSDQYDNQRPKRALATGHAGFLHDLEIFSQDELDTDPVYRDFLYPFGIRWTAGTVIPVPTSDIMVFDVARRVDDGPFDREMMLRLDRYRPHLARAALLAHRLGLKAARAATEAMEIIGLPAAVLATGGRALSVNHALEALSPRVRFLAFDRIAFGANRADQMLAEAIASMSSNASRVVRSIPLPATEGAPALIAHLIPIRRAGGDIFTHAAGLLVFTTVSAPGAPLTEVLTGLFDLTPAEVKVARGIAAAQTVDRMAGSMGLSRETVRTQLKSVMAKTGTTRQIDLALLLRGTSAVPFGF